MAKPPPVDEREFLRITRNHGEFRTKLQALGLAAASSDLAQHAQYVALRWLQLGMQHLEEAEIHVTFDLHRSAFSRSYYAAYNASKALRYTVSGSVSLNADDHGKAPDLPDDFPQVARWSESITKLREHRLRADYDNWGTTEAENTLTSSQAFELANEFVAEVKKYLESKYGIKL